MNVPARFRVAATAIARASALALAVLPACSGSGNAGGDGTVPSERGPVLAPRWSWSPPPPARPGMPASDAGGVALTWSRGWVTLLGPSGEVVWEVQHDRLRDVAPALTTTAVLVPTETGLASFERPGGRLGWAAAVGERVNTPVIVGALAVATTWDASVVAFELAGGRVAWRAGLPGPALGPPAAAGPTVVATFDTGSAAGAVAFEAATGRRLWEVALPADGVSAPAVSGSTVVVVAGDSAAHGLSLDDGSRRWRRELQGSGSPEVPPLPLTGGRVLAAHRLGGVALLGELDGAVAWEAATDSVAVRGGPAGPGPAGWFALPLDDGGLLLAGPGRDPQVYDPSRLATPPSAARPTRSST